MFKLFNKPDTNDFYMFQSIIENMDKKTRTCKLDLSTHYNWKSVRLLNKRGLIKYYLTDKKNIVTVVPTLFCLYLTVKKKYAIEKVYTEAVELYDMIGEEINDDNKRQRKLLSKQ